MPEVRQFLPQASPSWIANLMTESNAALDAGRFKEAARGYASLLRVFERHPEEREAGVPLMLSFLGRSQWDSGRPNKALRTYVRLAKLHESRGEEGKSEFAWESAARCALDCGKRAQAEEYAQQAVRAGRRQGDAVNLGRAMQVLATAIWQRNHAEEARLQLREALEVLASDEDSNWIRYSCYESLVRIALAVHDTDDAQTWSRKLARLVDALPDPDGYVRQCANDLQAEVDAQVERGAVADATGFLLVDLNPVRGAEASKTRPAVIVSNDGANITATRLDRGVVTVVPLTSNVERFYPFQVLLPASDSGLQRDSKAQGEQVRSVAVERIGTRVTVVPASFMTQLDEALRLHLSL
jgi:mRNA interferase MazF